MEEQTNTFIEELTKRKDTKVKLEVEFPDAWVLFKVLQTLLRGPTLPDRIYTTIFLTAKDLENQITPTALLARIAGRGWNPHFDIPL